MSLETLKFQKLSKKELKTINAGTAPDCEPGEVPISNGIIWECLPLRVCQWAIGADDDEENNNNSWL